jgi:predicted transcriptional regulator
MKNTNEIPRRNRLDMLFPSELAVWKAKQAVEELGCHPLLTEAVILLGQAQDKVSDYVDAEKLNQSKAMNPVEDDELTPKGEQLINKAYSRFSDNHFDEEYR